MFLGTGVLVAGSVANLKLDLTDYNQKSRTSLLTLEALATENSGTEVATCLQIHVQVDGKKESKTGKYCYQDAQGGDVKEGEIIECASQGAVPNSRCNKTTCRSVTGCYVDNAAKNDLIILKKFRYEI